MTILTYTYTRNHLAKVLDLAEKIDEAIIVTRSGKNPSVIMSMNEYESLQETLHLLSSPKNALRIEQSLADFEAGKFVNGELVEPQ
jgi:antitoxin YefM